MPEFESIEGIASLVDTKEVKKYEATFVAFYEAQKDVLDYMGLAYFDPQSRDIYIGLKEAVAKLGTAFRQCAIEILNSSKDATEFSEDLLDFISNDELTRLTELTRLLNDSTKEPVRYELYDRDVLMVHIQELYIHSENLIGQLVILYTNSLHTDLQAALYKAQGGV